MTSRAVFGIGALKQNLVLAISMGSAVVLLGCGGGGGGGNNNNNNNTLACGSQVGSNQTVVCGFVVSNNTQTGVNGVTVQLRDANSNVLPGTSVVTSNDPASGAAGFYKIVVPNSGTQISVDAAAAGYLQNYMLLGAGTGLYYDGRDLQAPRTGKCFPSPTFTRPGDKRLGNIIIFSAESAPPPPVFNCPPS